MSGLVGYHFDDSDDEGRRLSQSEEIDNNQARTSRSPSPEPEVEQKPPEPTPVEVSPDSDAEGGSKSSPMEVDVVSKPGRTPPKLRSPLNVGYAEQWKRKATPVTVDDAVMEKYMRLFELKEQGKNIEEMVAGNKVFKNPSLYDLLTSQFDIDCSASNMNASTRIFNKSDFTEADFYDKLGARQDEMSQKNSHHKSKSSKHHH